MPRKVQRSLPRNPQPPMRKAQPSWPLFLALVCLAILFSSGVTYLLLRPALHRASSHAVIISANALLAQGNAAFDRKDWPTAASDYTQAIAAGDDNPDIRTDLGTVYRNLHKPQKALNEYAIAQKEDPNHQNSLVNEGVVYAFDLEEFPQALAIWHQYLLKFPQGTHVAAVKQLMAMAESHASPLSSKAKGA
jgi:tetratricopeptide (TPR) repeat protein